MNSISKCHLLDDVLVSEVGSLTHLPVQLFRPVHQISTEVFELRQSGVTFKSE